LDKVFAPIAIVVAIGIAIALYVFAFSLVPPGTGANPPEEVEAAQVLWVSGATYLIVFVLLNFWLERIWFPSPRVGAASVPPLVGETRRAHISMGAVEAVVFIIAIVLIGTGTSLMGTRGYGSF